METLKEQNEFINQLSINMEEAIKNSLECFRVTSNCLQHNLSIGGRHSEKKHISLMKECAELCQLSASFMIESSDFANDICGVCARVCDASADSCADIDSEDAMMRLTITALRKCADSCRNMEH